MAYTNIDDPSLHFSTTLYTGDGSADQDMTGAGFKPDFLWIKRRNASERHVLTNAQMGVSNGAYKWLDSAATNSSFSGGTGVASFDADGFTIKTSDATWNASGSTYVAWNWKGSDSSPASNSQGGARYVTVSANTDAGFSTVRLLGGLDGEANTAFGHGLGVAPELVIMKRSSATIGWYLFHKDIGEDKYLAPEAPAAVASSSTTFSTLPTSTLFTGGLNVVNATDWFSCWCFASKQGYSKIGSYIANANADGRFIYTGFKPAWLLRKAVDRAEPWMVIDNKRNPINGAATVLDPSLPAGEVTTPGDYLVDFLSNGFKIRSGTTSYGNHTVGNKYIYMAFAENPLVTSTGIPCTAR